MKYKFRGKTDELNSQWIYGSLLIKDDGHFIWSDGVFREVDPKTVGQYIGVKDIDAMEIYEGDIIDMGIQYEGGVDWCDKRCYIYCGENGSGYHISFHGKHGGEGMPSLNHFLKAYERCVFKIIDNIHDNPDEILRREK